MFEQRAQAQWLIGTHLVVLCWLDTSNRRYGYKRTLLVLPWFHPSLYVSMIPVRPVNMIQGFFFVLTNLVKYCVMLKKMNITLQLKKKKD